MNQKSKITYWIFTLLFALLMGVSGIGFLLPLKPVVENMGHLGYPEYIIRFLGLAKFLGAAAILTGLSPRLKEWAYAGFTFDLLGATYSHLLSDDGPKAIVPVVVLGIMFVSYYSWRKLSCDHHKTAAGTPGRTECDADQPVQAN